MIETYLLDIVATEGKKEIRTTKRYNNKKELLEAYKIISDIIKDNSYIHSKGNITVIPKIILAEKTVFRDQ